jgi:hypothetical protein
MAGEITYADTYTLYVVLRGEESVADERIADGLVAEAVMGVLGAAAAVDAAAKLADQ